MSVRSISLLAKPNPRGTAVSLEQAIIGRLLAGIGGSGIIAMVSVIITGKKIWPLRQTGN